MRGYTEPLPAHFRGLLIAACNLLSVRRRSGFGTVYLPVMAVVGERGSNPGPYALNYLWGYAKYTSYSPRRHTVYTFSDVFETQYCIPHIVPEILKQQS
jgi:hypothetical protein